MKVLTILILFALGSHAFSSNKLLTWTCDTTLTLLPGTEMEISLRLPSFPKYVQKYTDNMFKYVSCACPGLARTSFDSMFKILDPDVASKWISGTVDFSPLCEQGKVELKGLIEAGSELSLSSGTSLPRGRAFKWSFGESLNVEVGVAMGVCDSSPLPWLELHCLGEGCNFFFKPCSTNGECGSGYTCHALKNDDAPLVTADDITSVMRDTYLMGEDEDPDTCKKPGDLLEAISSKVSGMIFGSGGLAGTTMSFCLPIAATTSAPMQKSLQSKKRVLNVTQSPSKPTKRNKASPSLENLGSMILKKCEVAFVPPKYQSAIIETLNQPTVTFENEDFGLKRYTLGGDVVKVVLKGEIKITMSFQDTAVNMRRIVLFQRQSNFNTVVFDYKEASFSISNAPYRACAFNFYPWASSDFLIQYNSYGDCFKEDYLDCAVSPWPEASTMTFSSSTLSSPIIEQPAPLVAGDRVLLSHSCKGEVAVLPSYPLRFGFSQAMTKSLTKFVSDLLFEIQSCRAAEQNYAYSKQIMKKSWGFVSMWIAKFVQGSQAALPNLPFSSLLDAIKDWDTSALELPLSCSETTWRTKGTCSLAYDGLGTLLGVEVSFRIAVTDCGDENMLPSFQVDCVGSGCALLDFPSCTSTSDCPGGSSCQENPLHTYWAPVTPGPTQAPLGPVSAADTFKGVTQDARGTLSNVFFENGAKLVSTSPSVMLSGFLRLQPTSNEIYTYWSTSSRPTILELKPLAPTATGLAPSISPASSTSTGFTSFSTTGINPASTTSTGTGFGSSIMGSFSQIQIDKSLLSEELKDISIGARVFNTGTSVYVIYVRGNFGSSSVPFWSFPISPLWMFSDQDNVCEGSWEQKYQADVFSSFKALTNPDSKMCAPGKITYDQMETWSETAIIIGENVIDFRGLREWVPGAQTAQTPTTVNSPIATSSSSKVVASATSLLLLLLLF